MELRDVLSCTHCVINLSDKFYNMKLLLFICFLTAVAANEIVEFEDCDDSGDICTDHEQCCGGCCFYGECINTYRSCFTSMDVCEEHVCIGEEECIVYIPPQCPGCEPVPLCRIPEI